MHGLQFGLSWIHQLLPVLQQALADLGMRSKREVGGVAASPLAVEGTLDLAIEVSERRRQRPKDDELQKVHDSGKKTHTDKNLLLVNEDTGKGAYLRPTGPGQNARPEEKADEAAIDYPCNATLDKDTGASAAMSRKGSSSPASSAVASSKMFCASPRKALLTWSWRLLAACITSGFPALVLLKPLICRASLALLKTDNVYWNPTLSWSMR